MNIQSEGQEETTHSDGGKTLGWMQGAHRPQESIWKLFRQQMCFYQGDIVTWSEYIFKDISGSCVRRDNWEV
jgi:hypothetical protein